MKKVVMCFIIMLCLPITVKAETLNEYIAKAEATLQKERETTEKKEMTEDEKQEALDEKKQITNDIANIEKEVTTLEKDIENLEKSIETKDEEIKQIMTFVQITDGESSYLEYIFGAKDFTDFIYRISVAEQLSDYNENLMEKYNEAVKEQEEKQKELDDKQKELTEKKKELEELIKKLSGEIDELNDNVQSYQAEYDNLMNYIKSLRAMGCDEDEEISVCEAEFNAPPVNTGNATNNSNNSNNNSNNNSSSSGSSNNSGSNSSGNNSGGVTGGGSGTGFYIPLTEGRVTQNYYGNNHNAIDITNYEGAPVYAITTGTVLTISRNQSCGKNIVYILHNVNGQNYTTVYYHLKTVTVSVGQTVYYTTQIGTQGGNPSYDSCSTGSHLDFKLFKGRYLKDFFTLSRGPHMDPRTWLTQLPGEGKRFYSR